MGGCALGGEAAVFEQGRPVVAGEGVAKPVGEADGLGERRAVVAPGEPAEVVGDGTGGEDQHAFVAQRAQGGADAPVPVGAGEGLQGQLDHRNVGVRIHGLQRNPGAVVEAPVGDFTIRQLCRSEQLAHPGGQRRCAGGLVLHGVQRVGKTAEIVDGFGCAGRADGWFASGPVGGDHQDGGGARQFGAELFPQMHGGTGVEQYVGGAVGDEKNGVTGSHALFLGAKCSWIRQSRDLGGWPTRAAKSLPVAAMRPSATAANSLARAVASQMDRPCFTSAAM